jgi:hypothetical protein
VAVELAAGLKDVKCGSRNGCLLKWCGSRNGCLLKWCGSRTGCWFEGCKGVMEEMAAC